MFWRKRRREMVRIFKEQAEYLRRQKQLVTDQQLTVEELQLLTEDGERLRHDIQKIAPPLPLTLKEWAIRGAALGLLVLFVGMLAVWKFQLIPIAATTDVSGEEGGEEYSEFVPITATSVLDFPAVRQTAFADPVEVRRFSTLQGNIVALAPEGQTLHLFYTAINDFGVRTLVRQLIDADGQVISTPVVFSSEQDVVDGSVLALDDGWLIAITLATDDGEFVVIEEYSTAFAATGKRVLLRPLELESFDGLSIAVTGLVETPYAMLTVRDPGEFGTVVDTRNIILRRFSADLQMASEDILAQPNMNADGHASYLTRDSEVSEGGFTILTNGGEPFKFDRVQKGDELMALTYNAEGAPVEFFQLTNNGRTHDFWPESLIEEDGFVLFSYVKQMIAPKADTTGQYVFPPGAGNVLVTAVDPLTFESVGGVLVTDYQPEPIDSDNAKIGATRPAIARIGTRLYVAYDEYTTDNPYSDTPTRRVLLKWFDLNK